MKIKVTVIPAFDKYESVHLNDSFRMECDPDNEYDSKAVAIYNGNEKMGYLATSKATTLEGTMPASTLFGKICDKDKVSEAWVSLVCEREVPTSKNGMMRVYEGECSFIPAEKKKEKRNSENLTVIIGGSLVTNPLRSETVMNITKLIAAKETLPTYYVKVLKEADKRDFYYLVENPEQDTSYSRGSVINPPATLKKLLQNNSSIGVQIEGLCSRTGAALVDGETANQNICLCGSVVAQSDTKIEEHIRQVVRTNRDTYSALKEKVEYMQNECVPDKVIFAVLDNIQKADPEWVGLIPHPASLFRQSSGDGELTRCLAYRCCGMNLRLVGDKGAGKNTLAETVDWILNRPQYRLQGNAELDKMDLLGSQTVENGNIHFQLSEMILCLMAGGDVVLDEGNTVRPEVADLLHSLTDESREIQIPGYGLVKRHEKSSLTLTMNENYMGTTKMNEATIDRFTPIQMSQPNSIMDVLKEAVPQANEADLKVCDEIYKIIKNKISGTGTAQGTLEPDCMTIRGFIDALRATTLLGLKAALLDNVANKPQDSYSRTELVEVIMAKCN